LTAGSNAAFAAPVTPSFHGGPSASTVYTETNQVAGNTVLAYRTNPGGGLTPIESVSTGGTGTGKGTGSQGGVTLGDDGHVLAVVNAGSDSVSVFSVDPWGFLHLIDTASSGGVEPISVTVNGSWVYALNAGNGTTPGNIAGFNFLFRGQPEVVQSLNAAANAPEQISFTPNGRDLVVTEKASNTIDVFPVGFFGVAGPAVTTTLAAGTAPYGFGFSANGDVVVSDAGLGALSSFSVNPNGTLTAISTDVPDGQLAPCWVAVTPDGHEAFTANAHSGTVSAYAIAPDGTLSLLSPAVQASPGVGDTDLAVAGNSTLYIADQPNVDASTINPSGSLNPSSPVVTGDLAGTFGLAATDAFGF
jgi:6-phosphogluconolactonase (cycloisomerase 2 family)